MKWAKFIKHVAAAYPGDYFPETRGEALANNNGDGLADFLYRELLETAAYVDDGTEDIARLEVDLEEAMRVITNVLNDVMAVSTRIYELKRGGDK